MKKKNIIFILSTFILITINLNALSIPKKSMHDKRILTATYNIEDVTRVLSKNGFTTILKLEEDERVTDMSSGFNDGWDFQDRGKYVFIKPIAYVSKFSTNEYGENVNKTVVIEPNKKDWSTNLIIITNKRDYVIDLVLANNEINYKITFDYPSVREKAKSLELEEESKKKEENYIKTELDRTTIPRNWDFYMNLNNEESNDITPSFAYDDGVFTYLGFDNTKTIPSVFKYQNKKESILNTHIRKDGKFSVLVIHKMSKMMILRSGERIVGIMNNGYSLNPLDETRKTTNKNVVREVINGK